MTEKILEELRNEIKKERKYVGRKAYSHNIIALILQSIDRKFGKEEANKAIKDFGLQKLGWSLKD